MWPKAFPPPGRSPATHPGAGCRGVGTGLPTFFLPLRPAALVGHRPRIVQRRDLRQERGSLDCRSTLPRSIPASNAIADA